MFHQLYFMNHIDLIPSLAKNTFHHNSEKFLTESGKKWKRERLHHYDSGKYVKNHQKKTGDFAFKFELKERKQHQHKREPDSTIPKSSKRIISRSETSG